MKEITQNELRELLEYDPAIGKFFWRVRRSGRDGGVWPGKEAGTVSKKNGYIFIGINRKIYRAHRLVWFYVYGEWPKYEIDHVNHDKLDNRIENLKEVTHAENCRNQSFRKTNSSGHTGIWWSPDRGKWRAQVWKEGKCRDLGGYLNQEDAIRARDQFYTENGFHSNHGR